MKLSVFYHHICEAASQRNMSVDAVLEKVRSFGISCVECDIGDLRSGEVPALLKKHGFGISSVYGFYDFVSSPDGFAGFEHCDIAAEVGADKVMIIPGFYSAADPGTRERERENMLKGMSEMCAYAEKNGLTPTVEDFDDFNSPISTAEGMKWFADRIPNLKITFDTGNFMYSAQSEVYAFKLLKDKIVHVHCKDRSMTPDERCEMKCAVDGTEMYACPVGFGCVAVAETVRELEKSGYGGFYVIEHYGAYDQLGFIERSVENLKGMAEK